MLLFWRWRELWLGTSNKEFIRVRGRLQAAGIRCDYRVTDAEGEKTVRAATGSFGVDPDHSRTYRLFVRKKDYERAKAHL